MAKKKSASPKKVVGNKKHIQSVKKEARSRELKTVGNKGKKRVVKAEVVKSPRQTNAEQTRVGLAIFGVLIIIIGCLSFYILSQSSEINNQYEKINNPTSSD